MGNKLMALCIQSMLKTQTLEEIGRLTCRSIPWLKMHLSLFNVIPEINVDELSLHNAAMLAKLPPSEQMDYLESAKSMKPIAFLQQVNERLNKCKN